MSETNHRFNYYYYKQTVDNKEEVIELKNCSVDLGIRVQTSEDNNRAEEEFTSDEEFRYFGNRSDSESYDSEDNGFHSLVEAFERLLKEKSDKSDDWIRQVVRSGGMKRRSDSSEPNAKSKPNERKTRPKGGVKPPMDRDSEDDDPMCGLERDQKKTIVYKQKTRRIPKGKGRQTKGKKSEPKAEPDLEAKPLSKPLSKAETKEEAEEGLDVIMGDKSDDSLLEDDFYTTNIQLFLSQSMSQLSQSSALINQNGRFAYYPTLRANDIHMKDESLKVKQNIDPLLESLIDLSEEPDCWPLLLQTMTEDLFAFRKSSKAAIVLSHKLLSHYDWSPEKRTIDSQEVSHLQRLHNQFLATFMDEILVSCYSRDNILEIIGGPDVDHNAWPFVAKLITFLINQWIQKSDEFSVALIHFKLIVGLLRKDFQHFLYESNDYCTDISRIERHENRRPVVVRLIWSSKAPNYLNSVLKQLIFLLTKVIKIKNDLLFAQTFKLFELCAECLRIGSGNVRPFVFFPFRKPTPISELVQQLNTQSLANNDVLTKLLDSSTIPWIKLQFCVYFMSKFITDLKTRFIAEKHFSLKLIIECLTNAKLIVFDPKSMQKQTDNQSINKSPQKQKFSTASESPRKRSSLGLVAKSGTTLSRKEWSKKNKYGENGLHRACIRGQTEKLRQLLQLSVDGFGLDPNETDNGGYSPLSEAAIHGRADCIEALIEWQNKSNKRLDFETGPEKQTPLHECIENNAIECAKLILQSGGMGLLDIQRTSDKRTPKELIKSEEMSQMIESLRRTMNTNKVQPKIDFNSAEDSKIFVRILTEFIASYIETTKIDGFVGFTQDLWPNIFDTAFNRDMTDTDMSALIAELALFRKLPKIIANLRKSFTDLPNEAIDDLEFALNFLLTYEFNN